jgi:hypothetical protein
VLVLTTNAGSNTQVPVMTVSAGGDAAKGAAATLRGSNIVRLLVQAIANQVPQGQSSQTGPVVQQKKRGRVSSGFSSGLEIVKKLRSGVTSGLSKN